MLILEEISKLSRVIFFYHKLKANIYTNLNHVATIYIVKYLTNLSNKFFRDLLFLVFKGHYTYLN